MKPSIRNIGFVISLACVTALGLVSFSACSPRPGSNSTQIPVTTKPPASEEDIYTVYSAILLGRYKNRFILVADRTRTGMLSETFAGETIAGMAEETINDYNEKNRTEAPVRNALSTELRYALLNDQEREGIHTVLGWRELKKKYPEIRIPGSTTGGLISFSQVGFNSDGTQALVHVSDACQGLCASGYFYFLKKQNGDWVIDASQLTFAS